MAVDQPTPAVYDRGLGLRTLAYDISELIATVGVGATSCELQMDPVSPGHVLRVERILVLGNSANTVSVEVFEGDDTTRPIRSRDWTPLPPGARGVAEYPQHLTIRETNPLTILVTGANAGDIFQAAIQWQLCVKTLGQRLAASSGF